MSELPDFPIMNIVKVLTGEVTASINFDGVTSDFVIVETETGRKIRFPARAMYAGKEERWKLIGGAVFGKRELSPNAVAMLFEAQRFIRLLREEHTQSRSVAAACDAWLKRFGEGEHNVYD